LAARRLLGRSLARSSPEDVQRQRYDVKAAGANIIAHADTRTGASHHPTRRHPTAQTARRCYALGEAVRTAIECWPERLRVVVLASGAVSLDVHGTKIDPGAMVGVPISGG
jgi:hypothetical protein